ncbi:alpha/beta hydrolase [Haloferula sp. BvORR071]|uniref:alpha/beta hydrolase n=1 Tax=Haloferula sp. BvORR071 TaxID=1396141 RepID=UPI000696B50F|nr:alpha/beta hydrolase [Haloferula sp. BvORR071]
MKALLSLFLLAAPLHAADASDPILIWPDGAPGSEGKTDPEVVITSANGDQKVTTVHKPSITPYLPAKDKATGAAVVVAPGGGHRELQVTFEGKNIGEWLSEHGIAAFVVKYRLARETGSTYSIDGDAVPDLQRAIRLVRSRASEWNVNPDTLGVMGFSAGGELCSAASMNYDAGKPDAADPLDRFSDRPAFQALIYPGGTSRIVPSKDSPPAFLCASINDRPDISEGLTKVYLDFKHAGVPVELHLYTDGGHGFGYRKGKTGPVYGWLDRFNEWMVNLKPAIPAKGEDK